MAPALPQVRSWSSCMLGLTGAIVPRTGLGKLQEPGPPGPSTLSSSPARVPSFLFSLFLPRSDIASEGPRAPSFESWFSPYSLRSRRRLPARSATSLPVHSSLASLCAVADAVARSLCLGPILVPCRAHHRRETLHRCAQPRLPSRLAHTHLQTGPRCRLLTPSLPRSARTLSLSLDNVFARHHVTFSNTALLDSVRSSTPGYRSPPRRAPALQHRRHPFSVMSQAFVDW